MDSSVTPQSSTQKIIDKSQMWKEKDADLQAKESSHAKAWESGFKLASEISSPLRKISQDDKMIPMPTTTNADGDKIFRYTVLFALF